MSNVIELPGCCRPPVEEQGEAPATDREAMLAILEAQIANSERAMLALAAAVGVQRQLLDQIKAAEGWRWSAKPSPGLFGDAVLYRTHAVQVVERGAAP